MKMLKLLKKDLVNLQRHIENVKKFGLPVAVAVNHFIKDTDNEVKALIEFCDGFGVKASLCTHWANGGEGTKELAAHVAEIYVKKMKLNLNFYMKAKLLYLKK
jgi:formate--tetrahydrofolate ligase